MKTLYPVFFTEDKDGILIEVPDLEILTQAQDMSEAFAMARDAIELMCVDLEDCKEEIPAPSKLEELDKEKGAFADVGRTVLSLVDIDTEAYRRKLDNSSVRRNVTLPRWLNKAAEDAKINVSRVLQEALMEKVGTR